MQAQPMADAIGGLSRALLVMHAPRDEIVGIDNASRIFTAAKHPKSFVSLDDADHLLTRPADAQYAASVIAAWASRHLDEQEPDAPHDGEAVTIWGPERGFRTEITDGPHTAFADEPRDFGGTESGPSPYGHLLASLGACTGDDPAHVRRPQGHAVEAGGGAAAARQDPRARL